MSIQTKILIIGLIFCSCQRDKEAYFNSICNELNTKKRVDGNNSEIAIEQNNKYLNLNSIYIPSDTFYLRVHYSSDQKAKIFEYSFFQGKEYFKLYSFPTESSTRILFNNKVDNLRDFTTNFNSQEKGKKFFNTLYENHILELDDTSRFKEYNEGEYLFSLIEISNKCNYKILVFTDPYAYRKNYPRAKYVSIFFDYLKSEFGL